MNNETTETKQSVFGQNAFEPSEENSFLKFSDDNTVKYKFLVDEPEVGTNKFGTIQYTFEVMNLDTKIVQAHSITSKRYMRLLEKFVPLSGKSVCVYKKGEGMETNYDVTLFG